MTWSNSRIRELHLHMQRLDLVIDLSEVMKAPDIQLFSVFGIEVEFINLEKLERNCFSDKRFAFSVTSFTPFGAATMASMHKLSCQLVPVARRCPDTPWKLRSSNWDILSKSGLKYPELELLLEPLGEDLLNR